MKKNVLVKVGDHYESSCVEMTEEEETEYLRNLAEEENERRQMPPTTMERVEAQTMYTALMTDTLIRED